MGLSPSRSPQERDELKEILRLSDQANDSVAKRDFAEAKKIFRIWKLPAELT